MIPPFGGAQGKKATDKVGRRAGEVSQWVKALASKPEDLGSISGTPTMKFNCPVAPHIQPGTRVYTLTCIDTNETFLDSFLRD